MGLRLARAWNAELNLITVVEQQDMVAAARADLLELCDLARISKARDLVIVGRFEDTVRTVPVADMDIMGLRKGPDLHFVADMMQATRSSCLFSVDSGWESAIA